MYLRLPPVQIYTPLTLYGFKCFKQFYWKPWWHIYKTSAKGSSSYWTTVFSDADHILERALHAWISKLMEFPCPHQCEVLAGTFQVYLYPHALTLVSGTLVEAGLQHFTVSCLCVHWPTHGHLHIHRCAHNIQIQKNKSIQGICTGLCANTVSFDGMWASMDLGSLGVHPGTSPPIDTYMKHN